MKTDQMELHYSVDQSETGMRDTFNDPNRPSSPGIQSTTGGTKQNNHQNLLNMREESKKQDGRKKSKGKNDGYRYTDIFESQQQLRMTENTASKLNESKAQSASNVVSYVENSLSDPTPREKRDNSKLEENMQEQTCCFSFFNFGRNNKTSKKKKKEEPVVKKVIYYESIAHETVAKNSPNVSVTLDVSADSIAQKANRRSKIFEEMKQSSVSRNFNMSQVSDSNSIYH